ncbi:hypothetical protein [Gordoniibacillus kamchatkensis]|uniref:hypothetical protein n=1 Tax=Gordoniibacillus kamchatkensis TaxID=1590651 RepID=UPI000AAD6271
MDTAIRSNPQQQPRRSSAAAAKAKARNPNAISGKANLFINLFFIIYSCACLLPVLLVLAVSFSDENQVNLHGYKLIPLKFSMDATITCCMTHRPLPKDTASPSWLRCSAVCWGS